MDNYQSEVAVFVIRIWREWSLTESRWYGRIEHVRSAQSQAFRQLNQMTDFVHAYGFVDGSECERPAADASLTK